MEQHPIPRQITTFEFKLIGFMTVKQFIYLVIFIPSAFIVYVLFPIPILNIVAGLAVGGLGVSLAFVPINDRPLDVWIKNMVKRLTSPTQFFYHKQNRAAYFLSNLVFTSDPHRVMAHIESKEKLAAYLSKTQQIPAQNTKKQDISNLLLQKKTQKQEDKQAAKPVQAVVSQPQSKTPFFTGVIKNHKLIPLPGILIYVKEERTGKTQRLLKTNPNGVFATFNPLPPGEYVFELKDPRNTYFFDTMKIRLEEINAAPMELFSKEML